MHRKKISPEVYDILEQKLHQYYQPGFIDEDPISIPHLFAAKEDIEISGFLTASLSWGNRKSIIQSARRLMQMMSDAPYEFVMHYSPRDMQTLKNFYYRTFQPDDVEYYISLLRKIYRYYGGLEAVFFSQNSESNNVEQALRRFRTFFLSHRPPLRTRKHFPDIDRGSAAKRICMFFRWMVRKCPKGIDFGIWERIDPSELMMPLDVHTYRALKGLGITSRLTPRWNDVLSVTQLFRELNSEDPCVYDFALFGMGMELKQ